MTKHKDGCRRFFKRLDMTCARCKELAAGASRRTWNSHKTKNGQAMRSKEISDHFAPGSPHSRGECGPVCTFGDW